MSKLQQATVILDVNWHRPTSRRPGSFDGVEIDADKDSVKLSKEIIRSDNYVTTQRIRLKTMAYLKGLALPSPFKHGTYLLPVSLLDDVNAYLENAKAEYEEAADRLKDEYPEIMEDAKKRLKSQFDPKDFPSAQCLRDGFGLEWQPLEFKIPEGGKIGKVLWEKEKAKAEAKWKETEGKVALALQQGLQSLLDHLLEQLKGGEGKRIHKAAVEKVNEFFDTFGKRNVLDDEGLAKLVERAKKVLDGKEAPDLRQEDVKNQVRQKLSKVSSELDKMVKSTKRAFDFDD